MEGNAVSAWLKMREAVPRLLLLACLGFATPAGAQDLVITNARIIDGTGRVVPNGSIVVSAGMIDRVTDERVDPAGRPAIDAGGMTVMPGLIDTHRHDLLGDLQALTTLQSDADVASAIDSVTPARMRSILAEGFTTVMMPGTYLSASRAVRQRLEDGRIVGPRLLYSGPGFSAPDDFPVKGMVCQGNAYCEARVAFQVTDPAVARAHVRDLAEAGVDVIKILVDDRGAELDDTVMAAIADEARARGLPTMLHAHGVDDMLRGVEAGVTHLVHTPGDALIDADGARLLDERGVAIATTVSMSSPRFAEALGFEYSGAERLQRILTNIRTLYDRGVLVAFGTDSPDRLDAGVEIDELSAVLAPHEIIATLTRNAAIFLGLGDEIGTLEAGRIADIVIVDGDPLADLSALGRVVLVITDGAVVVDGR